MSDAAPTWERYVSRGVAWARQVQEMERVVCTYGAITAFPTDWVIQQEINGLTNTFVLQDVDFVDCWVKPSASITMDGQSESGVDPHPVPEPAPSPEPTTEPVPDAVNPAPAPDPVTEPAPAPAPAPVADAVNPAPATDVPVPVALVDATQPVDDTIPQKVKEVPNPVS